MKGGTKAGGRSAGKRKAHPGVQKTTLRASGSATILLGTMSVPVRYYPAASSQAVSFNNLHKGCRSRTNSPSTCPIHNVVLGKADISRAYQVAPDEYVEFTDEELKSLEGPRRHTIELVEFVPTRSVDFIYIEKTHYLGSDDGGQRGYALLAQELGRADLLAVGRWGKLGKDQLVLVEPYRGGLVLHQVYYANEVKDFDQVPKSRVVDWKPIELRIISEVIAAYRSNRFEPDKYRDEFRDRVLAAVDRKLSGQPISEEPEAPLPPPGDLVEALQRTLAQAPKRDDVLSEASPANGVTQPAGTGSA